MMVMVKVKVKVMVIVVTMMVMVMMMRILAWGPLHKSSLILLLSPSLP